ncbi:ubiquitin-conjugating enzyme E2 W [Eurytemora carolleeae]|uniref:ubiquitin-conjugating enzyme E2 W n=1 Tax=Eurytemora carolleeae TaxID=1294199 RepID=UPI000C769538|nr:ubiquitin-conjugating enzyme E2 W [Eurytemora carolleeae]|eukprot:XP_023326404.1 ubiquitin-conjugating enzyme E2 W-like [Eurytemora affinis]
MEGEKSKISGPALKRLKKEFQSFATEPPDGLELSEETLKGEDLGVWQIKLVGPTKTLYEGETFNLQFKFGMKYPFDSPEVVFVGDSIPVHQHIYSNGHICLSILTDDWSPALSVESVCLSIISMLASAKDKVRPSDDSFYVRTCSKNPKKTRWWYHDDSV